ncbi:methyltransferase [Neorhizobium galegae]|uniref:class I SAM-dependent methyltransferase n=1 Tax=Neorhizobium galegae TaxID=399 RepID=UPI000621302B|nr:methyltransferase [Neorhizobium galegae]CDZ27121.1 Methyltransferase-like protein 20 [Neorhizobium galegae bv. officinalis]KAA9384968.1 methyltransferase [Neorhizobium galegae]KAB1116336.1 methyltransferase [Neorhizobium galegae]MCM2497699.1 methyltransferase [Neorhizobium galegae]MCQ1774672.1 methyltransferase [Neorhizobium galegae]
MKTDPRSFVLDNTDLVSPPHVPEIRLHLASEAHDLWLKTEEDLQEIGLPPPYWAFAWAGGQGLARYVLDHPQTVAGRRVMDFASGSGLVAIAAKLAGAADVLAADIDPWAASAIGLNAVANGVVIRSTAEDQIGRAAEADVILAGDVFYDREFAAALIPWFARLAGEGKLVLVGDPGRSYFPKDRLEQLAVYQVSVTRALEDSEVKKTTVWRFAR